MLRHARVHVSAQSCSGIINILGVPVSRHMRALVYMASRDKSRCGCVPQRHAIRTGKNKENRNLALKEQQYQISKAKGTRALGTKLLIIPQLSVLLLTKRHVGCGNEIDFISQSDLLDPGAGQKTPEIFVYASSNEKGRHIRFKLSFAARFTKRENGVSIIQDFPVFVNHLFCFSL